MGELLQRQLKLMHRFDCSSSIHQRLLQRPEQHIWSSLSRHFEGFVGIQWRSGKSPVIDKCVSKDSSRFSKIIDNGVPRSQRK